MTARIFVDETKAKGYVIAAATLLTGDLAAPRKRVQALILPRQRSLHMKDESDSRRRQIVDTILDMADTSGLTTVIYDAGREGTELERRALCLETLVEDAARHATARIVLDLDESLQVWDRQRLIEYRRTAGLGDRLTYAHQARTDELLLSIPDAIAWSWARGGEWRARVKAIVRYVRIEA
jgi:hypothetical protein